VNLDWPIVGAVCAMVGLFVGWKAHVVSDSRWREKVDSHLTQAGPLIVDLQEMKQILAVNQVQIGSLASEVSRLRESVVELMRFERDCPALKILNTQRGDR